MGDGIEEDEISGRELQGEDGPLARRQLDYFERHPLDPGLVVGRQIDPGAPEDLAVVFDGRQLVGAMRGDLAEPWADGEGDLHHIVERGLIGGGAEGAFVFRLIEGLQRRIGVEHPGAAAADDIPGHLEQAEPRRMQEGGDEALLVDPFLGRESQGVDLVERVIGRVADHALDHGDGTGVRGLLQDGEEGLSFAHPWRLPEIPADENHFAAKSRDQSFSFFS